MPFSSGTFSLYTPGNPVVTGTTISSTWANSTLSDIATNGLSYCILKDGTQTVTANIPFSSFRLTGIGAATARTDAIQFAQVQDNAPAYLTSVSGTNTITASLTGLAAYATGQAFEFIPANTNTGATTLNINTIGAKSIFAQGAACAGGEIKVGVPCRVSYDGTQLNIVGPEVAATQALQEAATSVSTFVSPGRQQYHPSSPKAWVAFNGTGTPALLQSYNVTSLTDNGVGDYTINLTVAFSATNYACTSAGVGTGNFRSFSATATGGPRMLVYSAAPAPTDENYNCAAMFGDQ